MSSKEIKIGDVITRVLGGVPMKLKVTDVTDDVITCGWWTFCAKTGAEIDEDLGWGPDTGVTGSYILLNKE